MSTIFFGLCTATAWSIADIFIVHSTRTVKPLAAAAWVNLIGAVSFGIYYIFFVADSLPSDTIGVGLSAAAGVFIIIASAFFFEAINRGPVGLVSALSGTYPAVTLALATLVFGATITANQGIGFAMVVIGVVVAAAFHAGPASSEKQNGSGIVQALVAACFWGMGYGLLGEAVTRVGWMAASLVQFATIALFCFLCIVKTRKRDHSGSDNILTPMFNPFILGAALTQQTGAVLLNIGLGGDAAGGAITVALSACYPVLTAILAFFLFNERISKIVLFGGLLAIGGIVVLLL